MTLSSIKEKTIRKVYRTLTAHRMLRPGDNVLVGVSGGPDSVALLHILRRLASEFSITIGIAHLNHRLRQDASRRDAAFVAAMADKLGLPCHVDARDVRGYGSKNRLCLEEAAREVRYAFFKRLCAANGYTRVALGHHADDNAELVLMFLLRGSGPLGLAGIPPVRDGRIIRPLIELGRIEIEDFLARNGIAFIQDQSNTSSRYLRNAIRHQLLPALKSSVNPDASASLNRLSRIIRDEEQWANEIIAPLVDRAVVEQGDDYLVMALQPLGDTHIAARRRIIRKAIQRVKGDLRRITFGHIETVAGLTVPGRTGRVFHLPDRIRVSGDRTTITISREKHPLRSCNIRRIPGDVDNFEYTITGPGTLHIPEIDARVSLSVSDSGAESLPAVAGRGPNTAMLDLKAVRFPLIIRNFRPGDRFRPLGVGGSQKLKKFLAARRVNKTERRRIPLLLNEGTVVWVAGHRIDESVKITPSTRKVLEAVFFRETED